MSDGRKKNGGHSTKPKRKDDKRLMTKAEKLGIKEMVDTAVSQEDWINIFKSQKNKAISGELDSAKFLCEYYFGKPTQQIDHTTKGESFAVPVINIKGGD